jgi:hypothetical protein
MKVIGLCNTFVTRAFPKPNFGQMHFISKFHLQFTYLSSFNHTLHDMNFGILVSYELRKCSFEQVLVHNMQGLEDCINTLGSLLAWTHGHLCKWSWVELT